MSTPGPTLPAGTEADVVVVGGGPAGSTVAWALARRGVDVRVLDRARFPREKVCGDYVDPRGLRILDAMGCFSAAERTALLPISGTAMFVDWKRLYSGPIPFYGQDERFPPHGVAIPREQLDAAMLRAAARAGAQVEEETAVVEVRRAAGRMVVVAKRDGRHRGFVAPLLVGADGASSVVARSLGLARDDPRRSAVARRAYATLGEAGCDATELFFEEPTFPGYGWVFPATRERVNLGVGLLSEARSRAKIQMPSLFDGFFSRLREGYPGGDRLRLVSKPIGGQVKTYGGAGPNHFDGGVLVGDAGSFVDPVTAEGITQGMESALLAAPVLAEALERGSFDRAQLAAYESAFRAYFDPSMLFLDFCATVFRNRHLARPWLSILARGCGVAGGDPDFARTTGSYFGGLEIRPFELLGRVWSRSLEEVALAWPRALAGLAGLGSEQGATTPAELLGWQAGLARSFATDPRWHLGWVRDVTRAWSRMLDVAALVDRDPRAAGVPLD